MELQQEQPQPSLGTLLLESEYFESLTSIKIPKKDLCNLRTISQVHYDKFNPIYLKRKNSTLVVNDSYTSNSPVELKLRTKLTDVGDGDEIITNEEWINQNVPYIFRKLIILENIWSEKVKPEISIAISQLYPHITTIYLYFPGELNEQIVGEFLNRFPNLREFGLRPNLGSETEFVLNKLKMLLITFVKPNIHITIYLAAPFHGHDKILQRLGSLGLNLSFSIDIRGQGIQPILIMEDILTNFVNIIDKLKFNLDFWKGIYLSETAKFEQITEFCAQHQKYIKNLLVSLNLSKSEDELNADQRLCVEKCLTQLSPIITSLSCVIEDEVNWDFLNPPIQIIWSKLRKLRIHKYNYSLEILKTCPKLEMLFLYVNLDLCIFHKVPENPEESLMEYFGNLKHLKYLVFQKDAKDKINESCLRNILPEKAVKILYGVTIIFG